MVQVVIVLKEIQNKMEQLGLDGTSQFGTSTFGRSTGSGVSFGGGGFMEQLGLMLKHILSQIKLLLV